MEYLCCTSPRQVHITALQSTQLQICAVVPHEEEGILSPQVDVRGRLSAHDQIKIRQDSLPALRGPGQIIEFCEACQPRAHQHASPVCCAQSITPAALSWSGLAWRGETIDRRGRLGGGRHLKERLVRQARLVKVAMNASRPLALRSRSLHDRVTVRIRRQAGTAITSLASVCRKPKVKQNA
jgi:hypothetical protein